jgi:hypothetical protein
MRYSGRLKKPPGFCRKSWEQPRVQFPRVTADYLQEVFGTASGESRAHAQSLLPTDRRALRCWSKTP